jgi:uncharacterized membrane protein YedE/YeeE
MYKLWFIVIGVLQMFLAHVLKLHGTLPHMQYLYWYEYAFEALFYALLWFILYSWSKNKKQISQTMKSSNST